MNIGTFTQQFRKAKISMLWLGAMLLVLISSTTPSWSQSLTENFNYTSGTTMVSNGWTATSGTGTNNLTVTGTGLTYTGSTTNGIGLSLPMLTNGEDVAKAFTAITSGSIYQSFLIKVTAAQATGDYFIGMMTGAATAPAFAARVYIKSATGGYSFGCSKGSGTVTYETATRSFSTVYLVVVKYTYNTSTTTDDIVSLWVNPVLGSTETTATITANNGTDAASTGISGAFLRQGSATAAPTQEVDGMIVGTTWAIVTPISNSGLAMTYNGNGNTGGSAPVDANSPYAAGTNVTVLGNTGSLVKTGYSFGGWNTTTSGTGITYQAGNSFAINAATTLYARWVANYSLSYDANGGTGTAPTTQTDSLGATLTVASNTFTRTGYSFNGWNSATNGTGTSYAAGASFVNPSSNTTLYAQWILTASPSCPSSTAIAPTTAQTVCVGTGINQLTATITTAGTTGTPTLQYQWYYNTTNNNAVAAATLISGATNSTYTPLSTASEVGTRYYFCVGYAADNSCGQTASTQSLASGTVSVTVNAIPSAPTGNAAQSFCSGANPTLANLAATGTSIQWYATATGGVALASNTALTDATHYYASQTTNGCESSDRLDVTVIINTTPSAPTGNAAQTFCAGATVADLAATGTTIQWYAAATGGTALATTTALANNSHYYASQKTNGCESSTRFDVTASVNSAMNYGSVSQLGSSATTNHLVISQVYGGGGNTGSVYYNDFIEIYNPTGSAVSLSGWSVQYASATGTTWQVTSLSGSIAAGKYYLIQEAAGTTNTGTLPTADLSGGLINMSATAGKVALVNSTTALSGSCPTGSSIIDFVGFGTTASCYEGTAATTAPSASLSISRLNNGCTDNNNNSTDFATGTPAARNSLSASNSCSTLSSSETICSSSTPTNMSVGGTSGSASFGYQWYYQTGAVSAPTGNSTAGWTSIGNTDGANTASYSPTVAPTTTTTYACFVIPGGTPTCGTGTWASGYRTVNILSVTGGTVSSDQNICSGTAPAVFTEVTASTGNSLTYQWESSLNSNFASPTVITGATGTTYAPASLTATTYYRRKTIGTASGVSCSVYSNIITVSVTASVTPSVSIATAATTVCSGANVTFTATESNGGTAPTYQWTKNSNNISGATNSTYTYAPADGDVIVCEMNANNGCQTTALATSNSITMHVNAPTSSTATVSICSNDAPYSWNGNSYSTSGNYSMTYSNASGCDSITNLNLTITPSTSSTTTETTCDSYTWSINNTTYTTSGTYTVTNGCHTEVLNLTITPSTSNTTDASACDSYTWSVNNTTYTTSGTYTVTNGCHTEVLNLTITPSTSNTTDASACDSYTWSVNNTTYTTSGTYTVINGCHTEVLNLTITPSTFNGTIDTACGSYTWSVNNTTYTQSGNYTFTIGCHTEEIDLTIIPSTTDTTIISACNSYWWNGQNYTTSGTYTVTNGCHTEVLMLTISTSVIPTISIAESSNNICSGTTVTFTTSITNGGTNPAYQWYVNGTAISGETNAQYTASTLNNNDHVSCQLTPNIACATPASLLSNEVIMTVFPVLNPTVTITSSKDSACWMAGITFNATVSNNGNNIPYYQWYVDGVAIWGENHPYYFTYGGNSCTVTCIVSFNTNIPCLINYSITSNPLPIYVEPKYDFTAVQTDVSCYGGNNGSIVMTMGSNTLGYNVEWSQLYPNNSFISNQQSISGLSSGLYAFFYTSSLGCQASQVFLIQQPQQLQISASSNSAICEGTVLNLSASTYGFNASTASFSWSGPNSFTANTQSAGNSSTTLADAGTYKVIVTDQNGCKDSATTNVVINPTTTNPTTASVCDSYTWNVNNTTYTTSGTYTVTNGCHTEVLNLTITPSTSNTTVASSCDSYTWSVNNTTYTTGGTYTVTNGCHTEVLNLTITPSTTNTTTATACSNYIWNVDGQTYTQSGTYTVINGCHTEVLNLTINSAITVTAGNNKTICNGGNTTLTATAGASYLWSNGATTQSVNVGAGTYTVTVTTANGCSGTSSPVVVTAKAMPSPVKIKIVGAIAVCEPATIPLVIDLPYGSTTGFTYQWNLGGSPITGATDSTYNAVMSGSYTLTVSGGNTCSPTSAAKVATIKPKPTASFTAGGATTFCSGGSVTLTAPSTQGYTYAWLANGMSSGAGNSKLVKTAGLYTVVAKLGTCTDTAMNAVNVVVNPLPVANIAATSPTSFCSGALCAVNVTATPFVGNYTYFIFYGTMSSNSTNPNFGVNVAATVKAMVTDNNTGCSSKQSSSSVKTTVIATPVPTITASGSTAISSTGSVKLNAAPTAGVSWLWYKDGNLIVGATGKTYIATTAGSYTVAVTKTGCTGMSAATVVTQNTQKTETNNIETSFRLNAYPNPVEDVVNISIETDGQTVEGNLEVVNSLGQKVAEKTITSTTPCQLSTANWTNGVYFIRYKDNEGRTGTIKITKQ